MTAKEVTRILEAAQGEVLEAKASPGRQAAARRGSLHLLDDRPADHGFFADVDECVWGVWAVLRRRFARDGVADPARAARCLEAWIATGKEAAPRRAGGGGGARARGEEEREEVSVQTRYKALLSKSSGVSLHRRTYHRSSAAVSRARIFSSVSEAQQNKKTRA